METSMWLRLWLDCTRHPSTYHAHPLYSIDRSHYISSTLQTIWHKTSLTWRFLKKSAASVWCSWCVCRPVYVHLLLRNWLHFILLYYNYISGHITASVGRSVQRSTIKSLSGPVFAIWIHLAQRVNMNLIWLLAVSASLTIGSRAQSDQVVWVKQKLVFLTCFYILIIADCIACTQCT